ncbi:hypothetical protein [Clostridium algidicarnis]|uniref:hypothetical protein n=1 Tax=Clostridium algidicarnis TaxID=37659 RepID=UPI000A06D047
MNYFKLADIKSILTNTVQWLGRNIRMYMERHPLAKNGRQAKTQSCSVLPCKYRHR